MSDEPTLAERQAQTMAELLSVLELDHLGTARVRVEGLDGAEMPESGSSQVEVFSAESIRMPHGRIYGGQVLAQSLMAASRTIRLEHPGRVPHSLHAYFMRPGDDTRPVRLAVERMRDGRSFSTRRVHAMQHGLPILSLTASFQDPAGGLDHHDTMPPVPPPSDLPSLAEQLAGIDNPRAQHVAARPVDHRHVEGHISSAPAEDLSASQSVWVRAVGEVGEDPFLWACVLAYMSDYSILEPVLRRHGKAWADRSLRVASLDHAMWFHRPVDPSAWLLYTQESPSAQSGRGLGVGHFYAEDGTLVATVAQEGMVRVKPQR